MMQIRFAVDLEVEKGDPDEILQALKDGLLGVANFSKDVEIRSSDRIDNIKIKSIAGGAHFHDTSDGFCNMCDKYSRRQVLVVFE